MAVSHIRSRRGDSSSSATSSLSSSGANGARVGASTVPTAESSASDKVGFNERLSTASPSIASGVGVDVLLPNGEINEVLVSQLQDAIHSAGERLLAKRGYDSVLEYKRAVQTLLKSIVPQLHQKESKESVKRINGEVRQRKFVTMNLINQKLDGVLKIVLSTQGTQLQLMKELDEIKGLIVNLLH